MGVHTQVVTSAVRPIPESWADMPLLQVCVSIDGLQPEHDVRRAPATYERILKHIKGQHVTVHCTVTRQQSRGGYLTEFTEFWAALPDVKRIWFSLYTPQKGEVAEEILRREDRERVVAEITELFARHPKLHDMIPSVVKGFLSPPQNPTSAFSRRRPPVCRRIEARITPCQHGGTPDRTQCGCIASVGLGALGGYKLGGVLPLRAIFNTSFKIGDGMRRCAARMGKGTATETATARTEASSANPVCCRRAQVRKALCYSFCGVWRFGDGAACSGVLPLAACREAA